MVGNIGDAGEDAANTGAAKGDGSGKQNTIASAVTGAAGAPDA